MKDAFLHRGNRATGAVWVWLLECARTWLDSLHAAGWTACTRGAYEVPQRKGDVFVLSALIFFKTRAKQLTLPGIQEFLCLRIRNGLSFLLSVFVKKENSFSKAVVLFCFAQENKIQAGV